MNTPNIEVVVISHGFQQDYERGFVNGLAISGVNVTLIGSDATDITRLHAAVNMRNLRGSQDPNRAKWRKFLTLALYHMRLMMYIFVHRPAAIHLIGQFQSQVLFGILEPVFMRLFAGRVVETVHNLLPHNRHTTWNHWVHRLIYRIPNLLVVHTEKMKSGLMEQFGISPEKIVVMQHGVNDPLATDQPASNFTQSSTDKARVRMLCFGVVSRYKGHDLLIEAMNMLDDGFELLIAGFCADGAYITELEERICQNRNRERIHWRREFVPDADVNKLFLDADVAVLPYRHIDQSGVLFKAFGLGCPVIATDVGSFKDYITSETGIITEAISSEALRGAFLTFQNRRFEYNRNSILAYAQKFHWSQTVLKVTPEYSLT